MTDNDRKKKRAFERRGYTSLTATRTCQAGEASFIFQQNCWGVNLEQRDVAPDGYRKTHTWYAVPGYWIR
jgi:hypothetical protein